MSPAETEEKPRRVVAVIGTGVVGRSWMRVFAKARLETRVWDSDQSHVEAAWDWYRNDLKRTRKQLGLRKSVVRSERQNVIRCSSLEEALEGAAYVQESGPESLEAKQSLFADLDRVADPKTILASSSSALDMTAIAAGLTGASRCVIAHPVNPPHVVPMVEIVGGERTDAAVVRRAARFMTRIGQTPVLLRRFVPGHVLNRMQAALLREAINLVAEGVTSVEGVDAAVRDGLGLRWALMGPFGVANTNADGGVREYLVRFGPSLARLWDQLNTSPNLTPELIERLGQAVDLMYRRATLEEQREWRDDLILRIRHLKDSQPLGGLSEE